MKNIANRCKKYLLDTLGIDASLSKMSNIGSLPFFLQDTYQFYTLSLLQEVFIIIIPKNEGEPTPGTIQKHINMVGKTLNVKAVFLNTTISSFNRKRLIKHKVPFIIPENQMYLPDLAIDLREYFSKKKSKVVVFRPSTQAAVLYALTHKLTGAVTPKILAKNLRYSKMTMSRSIGEIEMTDIADVATVGRERWVRFEGNKHNLWKKSLPYLKTPVKESVWLKFVNDEWPLYQAGLTALSKYSMLAPPNHQIYAIGENNWKEIKEGCPLSTVKYPEEAKCEIEIWRYNPALFVKNETVDLFSLYLSLKDTDDERVESALEKMLESIEW